MVFQDAFLLLSWFGFGIPNSFIFNMEHFFDVILINKIEKQSMKTIMNSLSSLLIALLAGITVISCSPCATTVCENGHCSNGTCVCETGFIKSGNSCLGVNQSYVPASGEILARVITKKDSTAGPGQATNNVSYTLLAPKDSPQIIQLLGFASIASNDITFTISSNNFALIQNETVITAASKSYEVSGKKVGNNITLVIKDISISTTYTITYTT